MTAGPVFAKQRARVFLEGVEVPFQSASLSSRVGQPTSAQISLVPNGKSKFILPRTMIHLFVQDRTAFGDDDYYLAFEGESVGRGYRKSHDSRSSIVMAMDYSVYWEDAKNYFMNPNFLVGKMAETLVNGFLTPDQVVKGLGGKSVPTAATSTTRLVDILVGQKGADGQPDLLAGVKEVLRQLGTVNEFLRAAYERLRIQDRLKVYGSGKLSEFLAGIKMQDFLAAFSGQSGGVESVRENLVAIMSTIFHEFISVPFPGKVSNGKTSDLVNYAFIPDGYSLPPPKCNVFFPNQYSEFELYDDFRSAPTRYLFRHSFMLPIKDGVQTMSYPLQAYPTAFSDYMFRKRTASASEQKSMLGPSSLTTDKSGRNYGSVFFDDKKEKAVGGVAFSPTLKEADFLTNEESLRGIFLAMDTFSPNHGAMVRSADEKTRERLFSEIGRYTFFKKRFAPRQPSAVVRFNPHAVPGFNAVFIDDSDAGQSFIAKLQGVTHIITNAGMTTQLELGYGRDFDEVDLLTGGLGEPPLPGWFDPAVFGSASLDDFKKETDWLTKRGVLDDDEKATRASIIKSSNAPTSFKNLGKYYQSVLGCNAITEFVEDKATSKGGKKRTMTLATTRGAVLWLVNEYVLKRDKPELREKFVREYTARPLVRMEEAFQYIGASTNVEIQGGGKRIPDEFAVFTSDSTVTGALKNRFDGKGFSDEKVIALRRGIIDDYVAVLKNRRSFRG